MKEVDSQIIIENLRLKHQNVPNEFLYYLSFIAEIYIKAPTLDNRKELEDSIDMISKFKYTQDSAELLKQFGNKLEHNKKFILE
jgi:hypothetical protein